MDKYDYFPIIDAIDHEIIMHRDIHFSGSFDIMLDYYENDGKGVVEEFSIERIKTLQKFEKQSHSNLSEHILTEHEVDLVAKIKDYYFKFRKVYESHDGNPILRKIADLILSEEEHPKNEMEAIVHFGEKAVKPLLELVKASEFYDPLYPGYGYAPQLAIRALGIIGDKSAIPILFEELDKHDFTTEEAIIEALCTIGAEAKAFLLKMLSGNTPSKNMEKAVVVLLNFEEDPLISSHCLRLLKTIDVNKHITLANYLIFGCASLFDPVEREEFRTLYTRSPFPKEIKTEMNLIISGWNKS